MANIQFIADNTPSNSDDRTFFGIDLGTTYTVVSMIDNSELKEPVDNLPVKLVSIEQYSPLPMDGNDKSEMVASVLGVDNLNRMYVGNKLYRLKGHPMFIKDKNLFYHWKLDLGVSVKPLYSSAVRKDLDDASKVAGKILNYIRMQVAGDNDKWENVVVTVPASFQSNQRIDVQQAISYAGIDKESNAILDEPNAAILGYLNQIGSNEKMQMLHSGAKRFLVIDFGGGTCDLSLLQLSLNDKGLMQLSNLAISRYNDLGGQDIDMIIAENLLLPIYQEQFDIEEDSKILEELILPQLAVLAERIKIELSQLISAKFSSLDKLNTEKLKELSVTISEYELAQKDSVVLKNVTVTAQQLYEILLHLFAADNYQLDIVDKVIHSIPSVVDDTLQKANLKRNDIDYVLYAGGSVQNLLFIYECQQLLPRSICLLPQRPDTLVAKGAAVYSFYRHRFGIDLIQPIVSDSIGIITQNADFYPLVKSGSGLPVNFDFDEFSFQSISQRRVEIPICIDNANSIVHVISFQLQGLINDADKIKIKGHLDKDKLFSAQVWINDNQLADFRITNPIALANVSDENRQIMITQDELERARLNHDTATERMLLLQLIREYYDVSNYNRCIIHCNEYLDQFDPISLTALNYLYCAHSALGQKRKAMEVITKAVKYHPCNDVIQYNYSIVYEQKEGRKKAIEYLSSLSEDLQSDIDLRMRKALLMNSEGDSVNVKSIVSDHKMGKFTVYNEFSKNLLRNVYNAANENYQINENENSEAEAKERKLYNKNSLLRVKSLTPEKNK